MNSDHPQRRSTDRPEAYGYRIEHLEQDFRALAPLTGQVAKLEWGHEAHTKALVETKAELVEKIEAVGRSCQQFHDEYRQDREADAKASRDGAALTRTNKVLIVVAFIGAFATIGAAVFTAILAGSS